MRFEQRFRGYALKNRSLAALFLRQIATAATLAFAGMRL